MPVLIRVACRELESFYLGDLKAAEEGLEISGLSKKQGRKKYRDPDRLSHPSEELRTLTSYAYSKVAGSRCIAPHLRIEANTSRSFRILIRGIWDFLRKK